MTARGRSGAIAVTLSTALRRRVAASAARSSRPAAAAPRCRAARCRVSYEWRPSAAPRRRWICAARPVGVAGQGDDVLAAGIAARRGQVGPRERRRAERAQRARATRGPRPWRRTSWRCGSCPAKAWSYPSGGRVAARLSSGAVRTVVLTISTSVSRREAEDDSGPLLAQLAEEAGAEVVAMEVVPDDFAAHRGPPAPLRRRRRALRLHHRRHRPDARRRHARGDARGHRARGAGHRRGDARREPAQHTPMGMLARGVAGIAGRTLIVNFPGSPKAIEQLFPVLAPVLRARRRHAGQRRWQPRQPLSSTGLTRRYGERVALAGRHADRRRRARRSSSSAPTARASRRCCACSPRCCARTPAPRACSATRCPTRAGRCAGGSGCSATTPLLYRDLTARENLALPRAPARRGAERASTSCSTRVGLPARADDPVHTYSRGMVQRLAVCRAVLHDPEVLLLDEPRANLDPRGGRARRAAHRRGGGRTRVVTSHDPAGGLAEADLALGLRAGRAELLAPAREIDAARDRGAVPVRRDRRRRCCARSCGSSCARRRRCRRWRSSASRRSSSSTSRCSADRSTATSPPACCG